MIKEQEDDRISKGLLETAANAYEPSYATLSSPYNTQATREVAAGKSGIVGNTKAGDKVYNPDTAVRKKISQKIKQRHKRFIKEQKRP
jgi:hypothetical protein